MRALTQEFIDDFLGYFINARNRKMNSLLIGPGLPGGMMGSLMADLEHNYYHARKAQSFSRSEQLGGLPPGGPAR